MGRPELPELRMDGQAVIVTRSKVYTRPARPGPAWHWVYTLAIPGEPHTFSGERLSWVRDLARQRAPGLPVRLEWVA